MIHLTDRPPTPSPSRAASLVQGRMPAGLAKFWRDLYRNRAFLLMSLPGVVLVIVFSYLPLPGIIIAFKNFKANLGLWNSEWVWFNNFKYLFSSSIALRITLNTVLLNSLFIVTSIFTSLTLALLLNEVRVKWLARFYQSSVFFPYFISWVIVGLFAFALLNYDSGLINVTLHKLGVEPVDWYKSPSYWPAILALTNLWKSSGYWSIVYLAALLGISPEFYEAAELDGASRWQQITRITLPLILPVIIINFLLSVGRIFFADFGMFYYVTRDSTLLYPTTDVIDTYVFRALRQLGDFGMAGAAGLYQSVVGFLMIFFANWVVKRVDAEKSIF